MTRIYSLLERSSSSLTKPLWGIFTAGNGVVTGWGNTKEDGQSSDILLKVVVPIISDDQCRRNYQAIGYSGPITTNMICAGYSSGGKDACQVSLMFLFRLSDCPQRLQFQSSVAHVELCKAKNQIYI